MLFTGASCAFNVMSNDGRPGRLQKSQAASKKNSQESWKMDFVFDLDGTICFRGQPVSDKILDALAELTEKGHQVIFASARPIRDMLPVLRGDFHRHVLIGGNGSLISDRGEIVHSAAFSPEEFIEITRLIDEFEATFLIDGDWDYAYTGPADHPILQNVDPEKLADRVALDTLASVVKILILTSRDHGQLAERLTQLDVYVNRHGNEEVLDISPKGIHKWSALKTLGIEKEGYVAFGNDANDITMFENAVHTVMIGHHDQLAPLAKESVIGDEELEQKIAEKIREVAEGHFPADRPVIV